MKLGIIASSTLIFGTIAGSLVFAMLSASSVDAADSCQRKDFKTEMVRDACAKGGQKAAKDAMKAFNKENKIKSCNQCHAKLAPTYELKKDGLEQFKKLGGKVLDGSPTAPPAKDAKPAVPPAKDAKPAAPPAKDAPKTAAPGGY